MSNKTQLQTNNTTLTSYLNRINAAKETAASLPDAGSGSGGSGGGINIELCDVTLTFEFQPAGGYTISDVIYTTFENNLVISKHLDHEDFDPLRNSISNNTTGTVTITITISCISGTIITLYDANWISAGITTSNNITIETIDILHIATVPSDPTATISCTIA